MSRAPRLMTAQEAAEYVRMRVKPFERLAIGRVILGTRVLYDRIAIDRHLDALSGLASPSPASPTDTDPEAAFARSCPAIRHAPGHP